MSRTTFKKRPLIRWMFAAPLLIAAPVSADVLWRGDFETGTRP